jgi:hypothetical protein
LWERVRERGLRGKNVAVNPGILHPLPIPLPSRERVPKQFRV